MSHVVALAPAKLNLALAVDRPGADGMHPICSWMVAVSLFDELTVTRLAADRFSRYAILWHDEARRPSDIDWSITKDLAVRAHLALEAAVGRRLPVQLKMLKRIPVGGGLGGGSSDAAAMLLACNELFELGLSLDELARIARPIGSDVPFLVHGGSAIVEGLGERIEAHVDVPDLHAVIVLPDATCPTGAVYARHDESPAPVFRAGVVRELAARLPQVPRGDDLFNDLAAAALCVAPVLNDVARRVAMLAEAPVAVSGSGSSLFVICDDAAHAEYLSAAIERTCEVPALAVGAVAGHGVRSPVTGL